MVQDAGINIEILPCDLFRLCLHEKIWNCFKENFFPGKAEPDLF